VAALVACGGDDEETTAAGSTPPPPEKDAGPTCPVERMLPNGTCVESGVPADACAEGFEADGRGGCAVILPGDPCPPGQLAVPGDAACRAVMPCPEAPYGEAPIEAATEFVDGSYPNGDSDGSIERPWTTIADGIKAAAPGAVVAIAAGVYEEGIWSQGKAVRLWGRCPERVEIAGKLAGYATVELSHGDAAELHDLSVTGVSFGVYVYDAQAVVLDRVHIHDTGAEGLIVSGHAGLAEVRVRGSLVERASSIGVAAEGATVAVESSVVRDVLDVGADNGWGVYALPGSKLSVIRSVASGSYLGIAARGSEAALDGVVVRDAQIGIGNTAAPEGPSTLSVRGSLIERFAQYGAFTDSNLSLSATVFRDALPSDDGTIPTAFAFNSGASGTCVDSLIERTGVGLVARSAGASIERLAVRDASLLGAVVLEGSTATIRSSTFERTTAVGVYVGSGSSATLADVVVQGTAPQGGLYGDGITAAKATIEINAARIADNARCGVANFGGVITLGGVALECNAIQLDGEAYEDAAFSFEEGEGELACGCGGDEEKCRVESSSLGPPSIEGVTN
jgi:hypothetical protein